MHIKIKQKGIFCFLLCFTFKTIAIIHTYPVLTEKIYHHPGQPGSKGVIESPVWGRKTRNI